MKTRTSVKACLCFVIILAFLTLNAAGSTVGCAGASGTFDFNSLNAAVAAANPSVDIIFVSGTCTELVGIYGRQNLTIAGNPGATLAEPLGDNFQGDVLDIWDASNLSISGLRIQANSHTPDTYISVVGVGNSSVSFVNIVIEGSTQTDGIDIYPSSNVTLQGGTVENNPDGVGVYATGSGTAINLRRGPGLTCPTIQNNTEGVYADTNASITIRQCAIIKNNSDIGVAGLSGASASVVGTPSIPSGIQILNNNFGILVANGGTLTLNGPVLVQGNAYDGIRLRAARGAMGGTVGPTISQNGFATQVCCVPTAGVTLTQGATMDFTAGSITGNSAPGVHITDNSSVRMIANAPLQITGNHSGVVVQNSSVAFLYQPVISGNGSDLSCTSDSRAYGDGSLVGRINCPGFKSESNPGLGNKGRIIP